MMNHISIWLFSLAAFSANAAIRIGETGKPAAQIVIGEEAAPPTKFAANELAKALSEIIGSSVDLNREGEGAVKGRIFVGSSRAAVHAFPNVDLRHLAPEEIVIATGEQAAPGRRRRAR
jgi:hypothetical protein